MLATAKALVAVGELEIGHFIFAPKAVRSLPVLVGSHFSPPSALLGLLEHLECRKSKKHDQVYHGLFCESKTSDFTIIILNYFCIILRIFVHDLLSPA